jgi:hypothetical protein
MFGNARVGKTTKGDFSRAPGAKSGIELVQGSSVQSLRFRVDENTERARKNKLAMRNGASRGFLPGQKRSCQRADVLMPHVPNGRTGCRLKLKK